MGWSGVSRIKPARTLIEGTIEVFVPYSIPDRLPIYPRIVRLGRAILALYGGITGCMVWTNDDAILLRFREILLVET